MQAGWDQFAQDWHEVKDLHLLGVPPSMHPWVLMRCPPTGLRKNVASWVRDDPAMSLDQVFDRLRQDPHNWELLTLDALSGKLTLAA